MQRTSLYFLCIFAISKSYADQPEPIVAFSCDEQKNEITFINTLNANYDSPDNHYSGNESLIYYNPWELVTITDDEKGTKITDTTYVEIECNLKQGKYTAYINPKIFNGNVLGRCGAAISGNVSVMRGGEVILKETDLQSSCHDDIFIRKIRIIENEREGVVEVTTSESFYH